MRIPAAIDDGHPAGKFSRLTLEDANRTDFIHHGLMGGIRG